MNKEIIKRWEERKQKLKNQYESKLPTSYVDIFKDIIALISDKESFDELSMDLERITTIDHGDYQGTILFVVGAKGYQPKKYWACYVNYGSCSGCDTFQSVMEYSDEITESKVDGCMTMALHMIQGLKEI